MSFDYNGKRPLPPHRPQQIPVSDISRPPHPVNEDRMYSGNRPIAYLDDLKALHDEVIRWLMGHNEEFGYNGYLPLDSQGEIDPEYIKQYFVGVDVFNNGINAAYNAKVLDFHGNLVKVCKDENGKLLVYIQMPQVSHLGDTDGRTDGNVYMSEDSLKSICYGICPQTSDKQYFGLTAGSQVKCFKPEDELGTITFETKEQIYFANNQNTKFIVSLYNALGQSIFTVESAKIVGNATNVIMGDNRYCTLEIFDFEKKETTYAGKIRLKINLKNYFNISSKFNVTITHKNSDSEIFTWKSEDLFLLLGQKIDRDLLDLGSKIYINGQEGTPSLNTVYGITYVTKGKITFIVTGINNLNNAMAVKNRIKFTSNVIDEEYVFSEDDLDFGDYISTEKKADDVVWSHTFKLKEPWLYPTQKITAQITISNAYDSVTKVWSDVKVKYLTTDAYINSLPIPCETSRTSEGFTGVKFKSAETQYLDGVPEKFNSISTLENSLWMQVIPGVGLVWPNYFGNSSIYSPVRYYKCIFTGNDTDTREVWGGTFIFGNLTLEQFNDFSFNVRISMDDGLSWYDLNTLKDSDDIIEHNEMTSMDEVIKGILCDAKEQNGQLIVRFALPEDTHYNHTDIICLKLTQHTSSTAKISYIKLKNQDNTQDF